MIIADIITNVVSVLSNVALILTVACWIIAGILYVISMGDPGKMGSAKKAMYAAMIGTALVILAQSGILLVQNVLFTGK